MRLRVPLGESMGIGGTTCSSFAPTEPVNYEEPRET